jgi:hypothetical protein
MDGAKLVAFVTIRNMKLLKSSLVAAVAAFVVGTGTVANAGAVNYVADGTYYFTATDGNTYLNGNWITFSGDTIVDWYLNNSKVAPGELYPPTEQPLTPANSQQNPNNPWTGIFGPDMWAFDIVHNNIVTAYPDLAPNYYDWFHGSNNLEGPGAGGAVGRLYNGYGDPQGTWGPRVAAVPDASGTLSLFVCALIALGACKYFLHGHRRAKLIVGR